jgi:hypothetical protein
MQALAREEGLAVPRPDLGAAPCVYYKNLQRMTRRFIAGSVVKVDAGTPDCLQGCTVMLAHNGAQVAQTTTDWFGDFKFDGLEDAVLSYTLTFEHASHTQVRMTVVTDVTGKNVDVVALAPASAPATAAA